MNFTGLEYLIFLAVLVPLYRACPTKFRALFLLVASYIFYFTFSVRYALLLAVVTAFAYGTGRLQAKNPSAAWAAIATISLTAFLVFFKTIPLFPQHLGQLVMPLGVSYYTFRLISYVLDVHRGAIEAETDPVAFFAYVAFFPQIVAGPIQRPASFFKELPPQPHETALGCQRIVVGLFKKLLVADNLGIVVRYVYGHVPTLTGTPLLLAAYLFPLQLYADFSGLTDIALGSGLLLGIRGPENFNRPFTATAISDFWRRWHISLTSWIVDYLFTPLRMALRDLGKWGLALSLTINMLAIGLWHGLAWGYVVFALIQALFVVLDALTVRRRTRFFREHSQWNQPAGWGGWLLTFHVLVISLLFFRARSVRDALVYMSHMLFGVSFSLGPLAGLQFSRPLAVGLVGYAAVELAERFRPDIWLQNVLPEWPRWARWSFYAVSGLVLTVGFLLFLVQSGGPKSPFLYEIF